ncbi:DUF4091 domain-containing protein [Tessaracoccus sp.]
MTDSPLRPHWTVVLCDSLEKVHADQTPRPLNSEIPVVGFRGERCSFQVAALPPALAHAVTLGDVRVEVTAPDGTRAEVQAVELVPVVLPAFEDADDRYDRRMPGLFPDLLRPAPKGLFAPVVGQWRAAWIDLLIDPAAPSGSTSVGVRVCAEATDEVIAELTVPVLIPDVELPELAIPHTEWLHCDGLADHYGHEPFSEENWAVLEKFVASAVRAQANTLLTPTWTPPLDTAVGATRTATQLIGITDRGAEEYEFDFTALHRWMRMCRERGIRYLEIAHLFTQWGAGATPAIYVTTASGIEQRFGWHVPADDPRYRAFLEQLIPALRTVLDESWGLDRVFFHLSDEPTAEQVESYLTARGVVADLLEGCIIIDAVSDLIFHQRMDAVPVVATDHADAFLAAEVNPLWMYYCVSQSRDVSNRFIALPSVRNRVLGAQLFITRAAGFLHWGFNFYNSYLSLWKVDPFTDTCAGGAFLGGDAFLVYPGEDGEPIESIRHRVTAEAFLDYRALSALAKRGDEIVARECADPKGTLRMNVFSYDADHYRRATAEVARALERTQSRVG